MAPALILFGLVTAFVLPAHGADDREARRWVGMITLAVQEYSEGVKDGRVVDELELGTADAVLAQLASEAPSAELDAILSLVNERARVAEVREAVALWFETHAIGIEPERPSEAPSLASGRRLYTRYCTSCHGVDADGLGELAEHVEGPAPADFTDVDFMGGETQEEFFQAITLGVPGTAMPSWGEILGERDRWDLVAYLWSLRGPKFLTPEAMDALVVCASCHGDTGAAPNLTTPGAMAAVSDAELIGRVLESPLHGGTGDSAQPMAARLVGAARHLPVVESRPGDDRQDVDPKHVGLALRLIVEEYVDAVRDGEVVNAVEYGEARLFHARLTADIDQLTTNGSLAESLGASELIGRVGEAILLRESHDVVEQNVAAVAAVVLPALGLDPDSETAGALDVVVSTVESARALAPSDPQRAAGLLLDAYIQFEPIERRLGARDPGLVASVERSFSAVRGELGAGRNDAAGFDELLGKLAEVEGASSTPDSWYGAFLASLLIIVREGLEVILVVSALAAYLSKGGHAAALRWLYGGAWLGIVVSVVTAFVLDKVLDNVAVGQEVLEGVTMLVAAAVLFSVSYWLISKVEARRWQDYIQRSLNHALGRGSNLAMAGVSFLAVYREGFETVLFYRALSVDAAAAPVVVGFAAGCLLLAVLWVGITWFSLRIPLKSFFGLTGGLLYLLAFRFVGAGVGELQSAGVVDITPVAWWPDFSALAMSPNFETAMVQLVLAVAALVAAAVLWSGSGGKVASSG